MAVPRYVILRHDLPAQAGRGLHWDLMLEQDGTLKTWALDNEPLVSQSIRAIELADHRTAYLAYEGPVSDGRGEVSRWDHGTYEVRRWEEDRVAIVLNGQRGCWYVTASRIDSTSWNVGFEDEC